MKNVFKYLMAVLACVFASTAFIACQEDDDLGSADLGLSIKVFSPTTVVAGMPMTINGSGFGDVTEIEFPGAVKVTDFELVTNEMLRVVAPAGMDPEGGKIIIRNSKGESAESRLALAVAHAEVTGFSKQPGEELKGLEEITVYGQNLQFIEKVELLDEEANPLFVPQADFSRIASTVAIIKIPNNIFTGTFVGKIWTFDGQCFEMPELAYVPTITGGHWETTKKYLWKNETGAGPANWGDFGYRFCEEGHDYNNECIGTLTSDDWAYIKAEKFRVEIEKTADWSNIRLTTGWWSVNYLGMENIQELIQEDEDGNSFIEINLAEDPALLALIDEQHLLFTGSDYNILGIYILKEEWVGGGGHMEKVRKTFWKNETGAGPANWGDFGYRFCEDGHDYNNECIATFSSEVWNIIKTEPFRIAVEKTADWSNIRLTTGWWSVNYLGMENIQELIQEDEDGNSFIEINLAEDPALLALIDEQHLLFTGSDYKLLEIYQETEEWVGGGDEGPSEIVLWEGEAVADDWGNQPFILSDGGAELAEAGAHAGQILCFHITPTEENWNLQIIEGHWGDHYVDVNQDTWDLAAYNGVIELELTDAILSAALTQQWWGGAFLLNGDNVVCTKVTLK